MKWVDDRKRPLNVSQICETLFRSLSYTPTCRGFMKVFSLFRARKYAQSKIASNESMAGVI